MYYILKAVEVLIQAAALILIMYLALLWFVPKTDKSGKTGPNGKAGKAGQIRAALRVFDSRYLSRVLEPIRRYTRKIPIRFPIDISPIAAVFILMLLRSMVAWLMVRAR